MSKLRILADGDSKQARASARGSLFEALIAEVLRCHGYEISRVSASVNYGGMEIDVEGEHSVSGTKLYAECKCYESPVASPGVQQFCAKYMAMWLDDSRAHGILLAIPGINGNARAFYARYARRDNVTLRLLEEQQILDAIMQTSGLASPALIAARVPPDIGKPGDCELLYTQRGYLWLQYILPPGRTTVSSVMLLGPNGDAITQRETWEYISELHPIARDLAWHAGTSRLPLHTENADNVEEIIEVRGSSQCFEYQFPASPAHFVGRQGVMEQVSQFAEDVLARRTSARGLLFHANSGWGKSSVVLASVQRLRDLGHCALAIDSRSASSSIFLLRAISYALAKCEEMNPLSDSAYASPLVSGFDGAGKALLEASKFLAQENKLLFIFFDQFENLFYLPGALRPIRDMVLALCDTQAGVVFGFSWKSDLVGMHFDFPYQMHDDLVTASKTITLDLFSEVETNALLDRLAAEVREPLREDLRFFLSDFSEGYPWRLKKLCAHVKNQLEAGVKQAAVASSGLNVRELFEEDLRDLTAEQHEALMRIAQASGITVSELAEEFPHDVIQSLVNRRLVVPVGNKYHVYWDIFRDYLVTGRVSELDNYVLRAQVTSVIKATKLLAQQGSAITIDDFQELVGCTRQSMYNVLRDMRLLGLAEVRGGKISLGAVASDGAELTDALRVHVRNRLRRNRLVWQVLDRVDSDVPSSVETIGTLLAELCPYISARPKTWRIYARVLCTWMDFADLAILQSKGGYLSPYSPSREIRERRIILANVRHGMAFPCVQYTPVEKAISRIWTAISSNERIDWSGFAKSTRSKALATLERLNFIHIDRKARIIVVQSTGAEFVENPEKRAELFAASALDMRSFRVFVGILREHQSSGLALTELGAELKRRLQLDCCESTAKIHAKIMLDWARHTDLAPGIFAFVAGVQKSEWRLRQSGQTSLFMLEGDE